MKALLANWFPDVWTWAAPMGYDDVDPTDINLRPGDKIVSFNVPVPQQHDAHVRCWHDHKAIAVLDWLYAQRNADKWDK